MRPNVPSALPADRSIPAEFLGSAPNCRSPNARFGYIWIARWGYVKSTLPESCFRRTAKPSSSGCRFLQRNAPFQAEVMNTLIVPPNSLHSIVSGIHHFHLLAFMYPLSNPVRCSWCSKTFHACHYLTGEASTNKRSISTMKVTKTCSITNGSKLFQVDDVATEVLLPLPNQLESTRTCPMFDRVHTEGPQSRRSS
jgi:hypothetical protein